MTSDTWGEKNFISLAQSYHGLLKHRPCAPSFREELELELVEEGQGLEGLSAFSLFFLAFLDF